MKRSILCLLMFYVCFAYAISHTSTFQHGDMLITSDSTGTYDIVIMDGLTVTRDSGAPQLPVEYVKLILPANTQVYNLTITATTDSLSGEYLVYPAQTLASGATSEEFVEPDSLIYATDALYPYCKAEVVQDGFWSGTAHIVTLAVYPVRYNPVRSSLEFTSSISIQLEISSAQRNNLTILKKNSNIQQALTNMLISIVANPDDVPLYFPTPPDPTETIDYVIICPAAYSGCLEDVVEWKRLKGLTVQVKTIESIVSEYPLGDQVVASGLGIADAAGSIRQFLFEETENHGLEYVLLIGDDTVCPARIGWRANIDEEPPLIGQLQMVTDLYFSEFEGDWNVDGDVFYGEPGDDSPEYVPDICVGRVLVSSENTQVELMNWIEKLLTYEINPGYGDAEYLSGSLYTVSDNCADADAYELIEDCMAILDSNSCEVNLLLEDPLNGNLGTPTGAQVIAAIQDGHGSVFLHNHGVVSTSFVATQGGVPTTSYNYGLTCWDAYESEFLVAESGNGFDSFLSNGQYGIVYSICCNNASYDMEDEGQPCCMARAYTVSHTGKGGPAYFGNTATGDKVDSSFREECYLQSLFSEDSSFNIGLANKNSFTNDNYVSFSFNLFGDPETQMWTAVPDTLDVAFNHTTHSITVTCDGSPIEDATVVFSHPGGESFFNTTTDVNGLASCSFEFQDICVTKHNYLPFIQRIGGTNETISSDTELRWDMVIPSGHTVTVFAPLTLGGLARRNARIIVEDGATLNIADNTIITGLAETFYHTSSSDIQVDIPGNSIEVYGTLNIGDSVVFSGGDILAEEPCWDGLQLHNTTVTCEGTEFFNTPLGIDDNSTFTGSEVIFTNSPISVDTSDLDLDGCTLSNSAVNAFYNPGLFAIVNTVTITNSVSISGVADKPAVRITNYPEFEITDNVITDCSIGLFISESGYSEPGVIEDNEITANALCGIALYHTYANITGANQIDENLRGMVIYHDSDWHMIGNQSAPCQSVMDNTINGIMFAYDSAPVGATFYFNKIYRSNSNHPYPLMMCYTTPSDVIDVAHNYWGVIFDPSLDLFPLGLYSYLPTWVPGDPISETYDDEALYCMALEYQDDESYLMAKETYEQVISEYPSSKYAKKSAEALLVLEAQLGKNYYDLQGYYEEICADSLDAELDRVCDYLANYCNLMIGDYEDAISWFEAVVENAPTLTDSVYAVIDAGFVYLLMTDGEEDQRSAYTGRLPWLKPESRTAYEEQKDKLLAMLSGDVESVESSIPTVVTLTQNYPNPFNPTTTIRFSIPNDSQVKLSIYNIRGQRVTTLVNDTLTPGYHEAVWNGTDSHGRCVSSGVYFYRLDTGNKAITKKMLLLK